MNKVLKNQEGAASIFIVIFFALLISVITLSFVRIINQEQEQALNNDLSQSAYDSAEAGVEDAKRALDRYQKECLATGGSAVFCNTLESAFTSSNECEDIYELRNELGLQESPGSTEIRVSQGSDGDDLSQAYTCVNVDLNTDDYVRTVDSDASDVIPLRGDGNFQQFAISWFTPTDAGLNPGQSFSIPNAVSLPPAASWPANRPSVMRIQLIAVPKNNFTLDAINNAAKTVFLYPYGSGPNQVNIGAADGGRGADKTNQPRSVSCTSNGAVEYSCSALILGGGINSATTDYYLRITPVYKATTFRVQLQQSNGDTVQFNAVQPLVDSTGRANDVFRRVQSRIRFDDTLVYPGLDSVQDLCKTFSIGAESLDYQGGTGNCEDR